MSNYDKDWAKVEIDKVPFIKVKPPGLKSREIEKRAGKYMQGYSSQASLFPVAFESGKGCLLGMECVKDRNTHEPFEEAAWMVYRKAFEKGVAWIPAKQNLRM